MQWTGKVIGSTVLLVTGFVVGAATTGSEPIKPAPVVKEVTKYVDREVIVKKNVVPADCTDLVAASQRADAAVDSYEEALGGLPRLLDDSYMAIYNKDLDKLNQLKTKEIALEQQDIQALIDIRASHERVAKLKPKCNKALGK